MSTGARSQREADVAAIVASLPTVAEDEGSPSQGGKGAKDLESATSNAKSLDSLF